jgi:aminopeptidase N
MGVSGMPRTRLLTSIATCWAVVLLVAAGVAHAAPAGAGVSVSPGVTAAAPESLGGNPSGGAIVRHGLRAEIQPEAANLAVTDTLTIVHRPGTPRSVPFPFLLAQSLGLKYAIGRDISVTVREEAFRPRDYWFSPPYDELEGYDRARTVWISPEDRTGDWPERVHVMLIYQGAVYDPLHPPEAAYARGFETTSGLIDAKGVFLSGASFWIPTRPDDRFTFRCVLRSPQGWRSVSQGRLVTSSVSVFMRQDTWDSKEPMEEVYFIAGPYTSRQQTYRDVAIMTFTYANTDSATCARYIEGTKKYLDLYGEKIGPYPFAKFALLENFWQTGFGMPSFTLLGDQVIRLPFILDTSYGHEILHNWWGNGVFVDYATGNWCEGLTTYGADYLYKERQGPDEARDSRRTALQGYLDYVSETEDEPLRLFRERDDFATQAIGYSKSMMVFHQIRRLLGENQFWGALQDFYRAHLFRRASWDDLFDAFSNRAGTDLGGWKQQWLDRAGAPSLVLKENTVLGIDPEGTSVQVVIGQTQPDLYDLRVPVRIGWNDPPAESTQVVVLSEATASCAFRVTRPPDWIAVDPDFDVLRRIDPSEIPAAVSRTLGADTAVVVIASGLPPEAAAAYEALAKEWDEGAKLAILHETDLKGAPPEMPTWFLGRGPLAERFLASATATDCRPPADPSAGWTIAGTEQPAGRDVVIASGALPRPWTLVDVASADRIATIGRKIPHYGKYSYLVFDDGKNIAKGSWEIHASPLRVSLTGGAR